MVPRLHKLFVTLTDMEIDVAQQIQKRMVELPADVRAAIQSADLGKRVQEIGTKHQLHIDQMGDLEDATLLVMLGFSNPDTFGARLTEDLHLTAEKGQAVAMDISNQIFLSIRESMKQFMAQQAALHTAAASKPTAVPPTPATPVVPPKLSVPAPAPEIHPADTMLREKTVSMPPPPPPAPTATAPVPAVTPKVEPPKPAPYKADPYREPIEP